MKNSFINSVEGMLRESLDGFAHCHRRLVALDADYRFVRRVAPKSGKVALVSGGGSGHEPLHLGFVGEGMLDAACPGQIFTSPTPDQMIAAAQAVECGAGVLFVVKNYDGDRMNFAMAAEILGSAFATLVVEDDVAVARGEDIGRRGVAGTLVVEKVVGAAAERGADVDALLELGARVNGATRSMGVALSSCTIPAAGVPTFTLGDGEMEMGVGIHGEPGRWRSPLRSADGIAAEIVDAILGDLPPAARSQVLLLVNGFGGTPVAELYLMYHAAQRHLARYGLDVARGLVGSFVTSLEMAGCSITVTVLDPVLAELWDAPVRTAALQW